MVNLYSVPRDLGLLRWFAGCRVDLEITALADVLEAARAHCRMKPERLAQLRSEWPVQYAKAMVLIERNRAKRASGIEIIRRPRPTVPTRLAKRKARVLFHIQDNEERVLRGRAHVKLQAHLVAEKTMRQLFSKKKGAPM